MDKIEKYIEKIDESKPIKQSNRLVEAKYKLTATEIKIVLAIASQLNKTGESFKSVRISAAALIDFCGFSSTSGRSLLKEACCSLRSKVLELQLESGDWYVTGFVNSAYYHAGVVDFTFDERLKDDLLNVKQAYLTIHPKILRNFKSAFSIRLYMLLKKALKMKEVEYYIDDIRDRFQMRKTYKHFAHFKYNFLETSIAEINEKSDIKVTYTLIKEGRAFKKVRFKITEVNNKREKGNNKKTMWNAEKQIFEVKGE